MKTGLREEERTIEIRANERARETLGKIFAVTALIEYLTLLLEYIDLLGPISKVGPRAKCPICPPPGPDRNKRVQPVYIALIKTN